MLTGCTHVHCEVIVDCLHFESCLVEVTHYGRYVSEARRGGVHGCSSTQFHLAAFAVAGDTEVRAEALQC